METALKTIIGLQVKTARTAQGMTQAQLAEKIDRKTETISNIERGINAPMIETLERLSEVLEIPIVEFFEGVDHRSGNPGDLKLELAIRELLKALSSTELKIAKQLILALKHYDD